METLYATQLASPFGVLTAAATNRGICRLVYSDTNKKDFTEQMLEMVDAVDIVWREYYVIKQLGVELRRYFRGHKDGFSVGLDPRGTEFQLRVWNEISKVPYGETRTYQEIADQVGQPEAVRAVGQACGANPLPVVIPCHRVVATGKGLGGYSADMKIKERLLQLEGVILI